MTDRTETNMTDVYPEEKDPLR